LTPIPKSVSIGKEKVDSIVMRRTDDGFLREDVEGIGATIDLPFLGCSLNMRDIYEGIEFTADCVQEPEPEYEVG
jgi:hypothetical protein